MNKITLKNIKINNFKGIKNCETDFNTEITVISGENGSGKTTIKKAYQWVLCQNIADIIPTKDNKEISNLETSVEIVLEVNGSDYLIKRTRTDDIDKKTGNKKGNNFKYYIDNIEFDQTKYKNKLAQLIGNGVIDNLNILSDNDFFNTDTTSWKWTDRRNILFEMCNVNEELQSILDKEEYSTISSQLKKGITTTEIKKSLATEKKAVKTEQDKLLVLVEDKEKSIKDLETINFEEIKEKVELLTSQLNKSNTELASDRVVEISKQIFDKTKELELLQTKELVDKNNIRNECNNLYNESKDTYTAYNIMLRDLDSFNQQREQLANTKVVTECYVCHNPLPEEEIEKTKEKLQKEIADFDEKITHRKENLKTYKQKYTETKQQYDSKKLELDNFDNNNKYTKDINELKDLITSLKTDLETEKSQSADNLSAEKKNELQAEIKELNIQLAKQDILSQLKVELEKQTLLQVELAEKLIQIEDKEETLRAFVKEQIDLVNNTVNSKFKNGISWALYNETYKGGEGGVEETCICMYNNTNYASLSNGEKVVANIEVVKTLQNYFGSNVPIFVDNAETVTIPYTTNSQQIRLFAKENETIDFIEKI